MNSEFLEFQINAPTKEETEKIIDTLLQKKLIAGANPIPSRSRFWWKGEITEEDYYIIYGFSLAKNKEKIIEEARKIHSDEVPGMVFWPIDANEDFLNWIKENVE